MKKSATYQAILEAGRAEAFINGKIDEARWTVPCLGAKWFGAPDKQIISRLAPIDDLAQLERLLD